MEIEHHVLHIVASSVGGGASHVLDLVVHGPPEIEQSVATSPDGGTLVEQLRNLGHLAEEFDMARGLRWNTCIQLFRYIRRVRPSVIHRSDTNGL